MTRVGTFVHLDVADEYLLVRGRRRVDHGGSDDSQAAAQSELRLILARAASDVVTKLIYGKRVDLSAPITVTIEPSPPSLQHARSSTHGFDLRAAGELLESGRTNFTPAAEIGDGRARIEPGPADLGELTTDERKALE